MTPEQERAIDRARDLDAELPAQPSPDLAASWWVAVRAAFHDIAAAFPEGGQDDDQRP